MRKKSELVLMVAGGLLLLVGGVLVLGNVTGFYSTFPYAGFVVMSVGGIVEGLGVGLHRRREEPEPEVQPKRSTHPLVLFVAALLFVPMFLVLLKNAFSGG